MDVQVRNLALSFGERSVLQGVSFSLETGSSTLLLGPSGSGKTSLLNIVCGLQIPNQGEVQLGNHWIASASQAAQPDAVRREHLGIIFQTLRLVSALSVKANLLLAQRLQSGSTDPTFVDATISKLGIEHRTDAKPHKLSQGEAQRAAIARALVVKPSVLIADEPTSALDNENAKRVARLLIDMAKEHGTTLLVATHDERLSAYFDRKVVLDEGRIAA